MSARVRAFVAVGFMGFLVQTTLLAFLTMVLRWDAVAATLIAVEAAVLTNFLWHERWTWRDRRAGSAAARMLRFHVANGFTSLIGNGVIVMVATVWLGLHPLLANVIAVGLLAVANFVAADRWVFARQAGAAAIIVLAFGAQTPAAAATLQAETVAAWEKHVAVVERSLTDTRPAPAAGALQGTATGVPGGTIHDWRGSVRIPDLTVARLVQGLTDPGLPPPQDDVVESRVLARQGLSLRVYLKLVRHAIVTATYETEHDVRFVCVSPSLATSRSIATKIVEVGESDRGFLWRLNSYWRYRQVGPDVEVDVVSLSLSRGVPMLLAPIANPIANRIARESLAKTLEAVRRFGASLPR
jgi:putative flippase GtrA